MVIGLISSFNKGASGGGYGPLVTGGQMINGREVRSSVGSATVAEATVCAVAFTGYLIIGGGIFWELAIATSIGSILAAPFAAMTVSRVRKHILTLVIGSATGILGIVTIIRAVL